MDNMTIIAVASIVIAGLCTSFGCLGPALAEGKAVAGALTSLAQQPDASSHHHANFIRRSGNDRIHRHLLFRGFDDSDLRQPVLESRHRADGRKIKVC